MTAPAQALGREEKARLIKAALLAQTSLLLGLNASNIATDRGGCRAGVLGQLRSAYVSVPGLRVGDPSPATWEAVVLLLEVMEP